jgi:2-haloacid dehalogenase
LGLDPEQEMMVAAHQEDLRAAKRVGFKAAFVLRPLEHGPDRKPDLTPDSSFDFIAKDLNDLASRLRL